MRYFIGLPQWQHNDWYPREIKSQQALDYYAQHFSAIEGNSTFYGLPKRSTIKKWNESVPDHFRFCLKFPKAISHQAELRHCESQLTQFFQTIEPLHEKVGVLWLQMNQRFQPESLPYLVKFLNQLPEGFNYGIEVRHLGFFDKAKQERSFNRLLLEQNVNRVMFDTRLLFKHPANDQASQDALRKKPRVPTHVLATAQQPIVRFISPIDTQLAEVALDQWVNKTLQWIDEGRTPYLFFHTPSNQASPQLAQRFAEKMQQRRADYPALNLWSKTENQQTSLF